jgi:hypothetical protein
MVQRERDDRHILHGRVDVQHERACVVRGVHLLGDVVGVQARELARGPRLADCAERRIAVKPSAERHVTGQDAPGGGQHLPEPRTLAGDGGSLLQ